MPKVINMINLAAILVHSLLLSPLAMAETFEGRVIGISDGDTLTVLNGLTEVKVRLAGIDAPEKGQPFGAKSKAALARCAFGKTTQVEWNKLDRYGRKIAKVTANGIDCGLAQIENGLAWHYRQYQRDQSRDLRNSYAQAENSAASSKTGLWADPDPVAPWDWRRANKTRKL